MDKALHYFFWALLLCPFVGCEPIGESVLESGASSSSSSAPTEIYVFQSQPAHPGFIGTRIQSNAACESEYEANKVDWGKSCTNFLSLLAYTDDTGVEDLVANHSVPSTIPLETIDGFEFAPDIESLILNGPSIAILGTDEGMKDVIAFSGFEDGGALTNNCNDWSSGTAADTVDGIDASNAGASWNSEAGASCTTEVKPFFCLCW